MNGRYAAGRDRRLADGDLLIPGAAPRSWRAGQLSATAMAIPCRTETFLARCS